MKRVIFVLLVLTAVSPVFAQNNAGENPNMYYINVRVERVYPSSEGYIVQYQKANSQIATLGIPLEWFIDAGGRAELLLLPAGTNWPTMSIFYVNGEFSHVRLYVHRVKSHKTWGIIPQGADLSRYFTENQDTLDFQY
jgi:hypothetical protein